MVKRKKSDKKSPPIRPDPSADSDTSTTHVKGKKPIFASVIIILIVFFTSQTLYLYIIPRVTVELDTVYHEAIGGGGTGGAINVNSKFENSGTVEIQNFILTVSLLNSSKGRLVDDTYSMDLVEPGDSHELKLFTYGNSFEKFFIIVEIEFETNDREFNKKYLYETHEPTMNIGFEEEIFEWGF
jgi:hypothetical protein